MKETLAEDHLKVNEHKTEETIIHTLKDKNDGEWRKTTKLGSLLGCYEDMKRRIQLCYAAFNTLLTTFLTQDQVQGGFFLNIVVGQDTSVLELFSCKHKMLLVFIFILIYLEKNIK